MPDRSKDGGHGPGPVGKRVLDADNKAESAYSMERRATYVYRRIGGKWLCAIDNSYGTALLDD